MAAEALEAEWIGQLALKESIHERKGPYLAVDSARQDLLAFYLH